MINANQYECDVLANIIHNGPDIYIYMYIYTTYIYKAQSNKLGLYNNTFIIYSNA